MYKMKVWIWTMGMLSMLAFVHIALWEFFGSRHITVERALHIVLPGYQPASLGGFMIGLGESFLWGAYIAMLFVVVHNYFYGIHHVPPEEKGKMGHAA